jgi:hypothetical protein
VAKPDVWREIGIGVLIAIGIGVVVGGGGALLGLPSGVSGGLTGALVVVVLGLRRQRGGQSRKR